MAYQFADPFDHYTTPGQMYETVSGTVSISSSYARFPAIGGFPNQGMHVSGGVRKNLKSNQATLIGFLSFGVSGLPFHPDILLSFWDNTTLQVFLGITPTGALQFYTQVPTFSPVPIGPSSALGLISPIAGTVPNHGVEVVVTCSNSGGQVECWLDGALVIALTGGLDTQLSVNAYFNQAGISAPNGQGFNNGLDIYVDYFRVWDSTGSYQNAAVGFDIRKLSKLAAGAGHYTQWTANGAGSNYQCVNENPPDGDTTYVSSTGNNYDSYVMGTSGLAGVPSMVVVKSYARKDDGATRQLQIGVRSGSTDGLGTSSTMSSAYGWVDNCISVDPATGSPPTAAAADAFEHLKYESA